MTEEDPLILNRYRPLETRGAGGSGTVEICWDTRIQRRVAIKHMPLVDWGAGNAGATDGKVPGLAEARTGAMLNHPNIVSVIDFETTDDEALLIMEAIEGPTLAELIDATPAGELDRDIVAHIEESVAAALDFAHENQVLHLDIKPENILITQGGAVKVSDFGISELADAQGFGSASGGTVGYMPPEQMRGLDLDQRCDEFALAVVVYEMLTGRNPFMAPTPEASLKLIEGRAPAPPSSLRGDLDPELDEVLLAALSPDADDRPETIYDFSHMLDGLLGDTKAGHAKLKALVQPDDEGPAAERPRHAHGDLWERIPHGASTVLGRIAAAALCWALAALGLVATGGLEPSACALVALVAAVAAAAKPQLGSLVALCLLGIGCLCAPELPDLLGAALIAVGVLWPALLWRQGAADVNCALCVAPLQLVGLAPVAPLMAGFCLTPGRAAASSAVGALVSLALGVVTQGGLPFASASVAVREGTSGIAIFQQWLTEPPAWIIIVSWVISAVLVSVFCSRQTRVSSAIGVVAGAVVLLAAQAAACWMFAGDGIAPGSLNVVPTLIAAVCMIVVCALGAPRRERGDN